MRMTKRLKALVGYVVYEGIWKVYEGGHHRLDGYEAYNYNDYTEDEWDFVREWIDRRLGI